MRTILLRTALLFHLSLFTFHFAGAQRAALPTVGEVYNFSQGDSFLYKLTDIYTGRVIMYVDWVILLRDDSHFPDSLVYNVQEIFLDSNGLNPAVWDTVRRVYRNCNDTIFPYNGFISCQGGDSCGTTSATIATTDSLFPGLTVYHADFRCGWWNSGWNNAAVGLGIVHAFTDCGDLISQLTDIVLVHYYKNPTAVPSPLFTGKAEVNIYPNPANDAVTIRVDEEMIGSTATITNVTGRKMAAVSLTTRHSLLTTHHLPNGVYFVTIESGKQNVTQKLIITQ